MHNKIIIAFMSVGLILAMAINSKVLAQQSTEIKNDYSDIPTSNSGASESNSNRSVIWTNNFSLASDWTLSVSPGTSDNWVVGTSGPTGQFSIGGISSTTTTNGYALFNSDLQCSGNQNAHITTAQPINCIGQPVVLLTFQEYYRKYNDSTYAEVSTNGSSWTKFPVNTAVANNTSTANPLVVSIDISSIAANKATVWIRFTFYSNTTVFGANGGCGYAWMIDDVLLETEPFSAMNENSNNNLTVMQNHPNPFNGLSTIQYTLTENSNVIFTVTDLTGRVVKVIENTNVSAGKHNLVLNSTDFAPGLYNYTLTSNSKSVTKKMFIAK